MQMAVRSETQRLAIIAKAVEIYKSFPEAVSFQTTLAQFTTEFRMVYPHINDRGIHMYFLAAGNFARVDAFDIKQAQIRQQINQ